MTENATNRFLATACAQDFQIIDIGDFPGRALVMVVRADGWLGKTSVLLCPASMPPELYAPAIRR
jgi:hypothetical protein